MSKEVDVEELLSEIFEANEPKGNEWVNVKVIEIGYEVVTNIKDMNLNSGLEEMKKLGFGLVSVIANDFGGVSLIFGEI